MGMTHSFSTGKTHAHINCIALSTNAIVWEHTFILFSVGQKVLFETQKNSCAH